MLRNLLGHMIVLFEIFSGKSIMFSIVAYQFKFLPAVHKGPLLYTFLPKLVSCLFYNVQSNIVALIFVSDD